MSKVYISLGTNLGDKRANLNASLDKLNERVGNVVSLSAFYNTAPWGFSSDNSFLNAACCIITQLSPFQLLKEIKEIEKEMGRDIKSVNGVYHDRIIDIDILLYDDLQINTSELVIPHPLMSKRDFVMIPLKEIAPNVVHPILKQQIKDCIDKS